MRQHGRYALLALHVIEQTLQTTSKAKKKEKKTPTPVEYQTKLLITFGHLLLEVVQALGWLT